VQALSGQALELVGDGSTARDWLHVEDHCAALFAALLDGRPGAVYHLASGHALRDIDLAHRVLEHLGREPDSISWRGGELESQALEDAGFTEQPEPLAWKPRHPLDTGLRAAIDWYIRHREWWESLTNR
jgi:dTDP-glucose 4,6-dehydratase